MYYKYIMSLSNVHVIPLIISAHKGEWECPLKYPQIMSTYIKEENATPQPITYYHMLC